MKQYESCGGHVFRERKKTHNYINTKTSLYHGYGREE
jgi:hypothetical protein